MATGPEAVKSKMTGTAMASPNASALPQALLEWCMQGEAGQNVHVLGVSQGAGGEC